MLRGRAGAGKASGRVRRAVAREMGRPRLEAELRELALERDEVIYDRFDHIVKQCEILDLAGPLDAEALFDRVAELLAPRLDCPAKLLREKLTEREASSSPVVQPGVAIPHIIVPGRRRFDLLAVRCREGMVFRPDEPPVHAAFILAGSPDERNHHLRVLPAIAQIVQEPRYADRRRAARDAESLRDLLLLSGRPRES